MDAITPEASGELKPSTKDIGPRTALLTRLANGQPTVLALQQMGISEAEHHRWNREPGWVQLEASARTIGDHKGSRGLADKLLEATTLGTVVRTLSIAEDQANVPETRLNANKVLGKWQGLEPKRETTIQVGVHTTIQAPPRVPESVDITVTPKDQQSTEQDKAGL